MFKEFNFKKLKKLSILNIKVDDKGILVPIGRWKGPFGVNRWMNGNFVPLLILQG